MLLAPAMLGIKLAVANVHAAELDERRAVRLWEDEAHRVRLDDLQPRPRRKVQKLPGQVRLLQADVFLPVELDQLGVEGLAVVKAHPLAQPDLQGAVVEPPPLRRQTRCQLAILVKFMRCSKTLCTMVIKL